MLKALYKTNFVKIFVKVSLRMMKMIVIIVLS